MRRAILIGIFVALVSPVAFAYTPPPRPIVGEGGVSCANFLRLNERFPGPSKTGFLAWAEGFISGDNVERGVVSQEPPYNLGGTSFPRSAEWAYLTDYCGKHPAVVFAIAAANLLIVEERARPH